MVRSPVFTSPYVLTEGRIAAWTRAGRGLCQGVDYRPWLTTRNVKSRGRKHRMRGILHDRVFHLMSDLERNAVLHFESQRPVIDIREQFPLDRELTRAIAGSMGVRHPTDPASKIESVMTTDLVVSFRPPSGGLVARAFSVKPAADLLDARVKEKQEIERRYWERLGVRWMPLLDNILRDTGRFEALRWVRDWFYVDGVGGLDELDWERRRRRVLRKLEGAGDIDICEFVARVSESGGFGTGEVFSTLRHLAARRLVGFDASLGVPNLASPIARFTPLAHQERLAALGCGPATCSARSRTDTIRRWRTAAWTAIWSSGPIPTAT